MKKILLEIIQKTGQFGWFFVALLMFMACVLFGVLGGVHSLIHLAYGFVLGFIAAGCFSFADRLKHSHIVPMWTRFKVHASAWIHNTTPVEVVCS